MLIASFNYIGPDWTPILVALGVAVALALLSYRIRNTGITTRIGLFYGLAASWIVLGMAKGDMAGFVQIFYTPVLGVIGGLIGGFMGWLGKHMAKRNQEDGEENEQSEGP